MPVAPPATWFNGSETRARSGLCMSAEHCTRRIDAIAQRWCDLAERRRAYFVELFDSGRWTHYYNEQEFLERLRDVVKATDAWRQLAPRDRAAEQSARKAS